MTSLETMAVPGSEPVAGGETGLHSPPETNMKDTTSDSELSDLDPEQVKDELGELHPDHFSPDGTVPVFKPTMEEFADFQRYMRGIQQYGMRHGIVKVIPPAEWIAKQPRLDETVKTIRIKEPISQEIMGASGTYRQANILHQRSYNLPQWRQLCDQSEHQPPAKRGERRAQQGKPVKATPRAPPKAKGSTPAKGSTKKKAGAKGKGKSKGRALEDEGGADTPDRLPTPDSPSIKTEEPNIPVKSTELGDDECQDKPKGGRQPKAISVSSRRKFNRREASSKIDEEAFKDFDYELLGVDYSQERCDELERSYWKSLTYAPPLYGADMMGSLFDDQTTTWNLGKLENLLDVLGTKIPGVNTAYLYLGMWKATFAWHLEDVDLYSINYLHFGAPKQWYSISQGDARRFEAAMKTIWPVDAKACDQFLRHKTFLISPAQLMQSFNIKVNKIVHRPGEFVITFPYGYHSGYNLGYNCAEAVNFALDCWLPYGRVAKKCDCSQAQDSVWIDVAALDRKIRGEETEYEETDEEEDEEDQGLENGGADALTPPVSGGETKIKIPQKKRKRPVNDKVQIPTAKKIRVRIKAPSKEPCILCPNDLPLEPLLPTEDGLKAHRICALYIPETSISDGDREVVTDIKYIDKARLELKCNYCRSKKGACFQCSQKKCTRAYHATCAAAAGVLVEQGEIPVFGEDGTEYKDWGIEFSCRFHRVKRDYKKLDFEALGDNDRVFKAASLLKAGDTCQMQFYKGDIFAGTVVENRQSEEMLLLDILPRGDRVEVQYKWLLIPDPADYRLIKPSANAIPMPKSFKDKESLNTSKRAADDLPRADDHFVQGCTWSEFKSEAIPRNPAQVKVDFTKENQIWYYLGKTSTEAKAQFTEDPRKPHHNPQGHFLDTIPKPAPIVSRQSYSASYPSKTTSQTSTSSSKPPVRPSQPVSGPANKSDRPYVYKPRVLSSGSYHVDPQAYRSQQTFIQQSQSRPQVQPQSQAQIPAQRPQAYSFGTDPQWQSPAKRAAAAAQFSTHGSSPLIWTGLSSDSGPYTSQPGTNRPPTSTTPVHPAPPPLPKSSTQNHLPQPSVQSGTPLSANPILPPKGSGFHAPPSAAIVPPPKSSTLVRPPSSAAPLAAPQNHQRAHIRPSQTSTASSSQRPNNPFSGRTQSIKPNPFAKYSYLQKEHNKSPLEYKTPYRPGGGFMNGYQGNVTEHWKRTLFQDRPGSGLPASMSPPAENSMTPLNPNHHSANQYSSSLPRVLGPSGSQTSMRQTAPQIPRQTSPGPPQTSWERKEAPQLHPAIRQEYGSIFQGDHQSHTPHFAQSQNQAPSQTQHHSQVMQPPAMYDRHASQTQGYQVQKPQQPHPTGQPEHRQAHASLSASHPQSYSQANSERPSFQPQQYLPGNLTPHTSQSEISKQQPVPVPTYHSPLHNKQSQPQTQEHQPMFAPQHSANTIQPQEPSQRPQMLTEGVAAFPHQQSSEKSPSEPLNHQPKSFTDVPVDSTSIIEKLMQNLRRVKEA